MTPRDEAARLRDLAEAQLKAAPAGAAASGDAAAGDLQRLVHELQVHQIELEMQNNELRQSRTEREVALARYTELYDFAPVGYLTLDDAGRIEQINLTGATLLGVPRRTLLQKRFVAHVARPDRDLWDRFLQSVKSHEGQENTELTLQRGDGTTFQAQLDCVRHRMDTAGAAISAARETPGVSIALSDISVRKGVEAKLHEAVVTAEKANRAKTDFLSSMSHELRTPLNAILGFAQLMETGTPPPTAAQRRDLERILQAGWYLLQLIDEILDLALIESGRTLLSHEPVALAELMLECRAMIEPQAAKRGIAMSFPQCESTHCIHADRVRVKQVLINLLFNAVKYNRPGGTVQVECSTSSPETLRIGVRDSGAGMAPEQLANLFQPFNRLGREAGPEMGTGIGLVVSKRLVELMGGSIGVVSSVGVGSLFWIELKQASAAPPAAADAAPLLRQAAAVPGQAPLRTVLHVEDNSANLEMVEQLIARRPDLRLIAAADGTLGIEFALAYLPDVIVMDISLPDISGLDAMKLLRADPSTAHIPIIALSANALPSDIEKGLAAGFYRYVTKPIRIGEFMAALDSALAFAASSGPRTAAQ